MRGQCLRLKKNKVMMAKEHRKIEQEGDVAELRKEIRSVGLQIDINTSITALWMKLSLYVYVHTRRRRKQHEKEQDDKDPGVTNQVDNQLKKDVMDRMMGVVYVKQANKARYDKLLTTIRDQYSFNIDVYPKSLHDAYEQLENHSSANKNKKDDGDRGDRRRLSNGRRR